MEKEKIAIGFDLGTTSVGWSIIKIKPNETNENLEILDMGVRLFDDPASSDSNVENRRLARGRRRRINRQKIRKNDLGKLLLKYHILNSYEEFELIIKKSFFDPIDKKWLMPLDIKIKGLSKQLSKDEIVIILHNYIKHRGTLNTIDVNEEEEKEIQKLSQSYDISKLPCQNQMDWFKITGKVLGNKENSIISNEEYKKEIRKILENQAIIKDKNFINEFIELFSRHRHYSEGPGSEKSPSPYGLWRVNEQTLKVEKIGDNLWDHLIGKCTYYKNEPRNFKKSPITEYFNLLNDFANIKIENNDEKRYLSLEEKQLILDKSDYKTLTLNKFLKLINLTENNIIGGLRKDKNDKLVIEELKSIKRISKWLIENKIKDSINYLNIDDIKYMDNIFKMGVSKQNVNERIEIFKKNINIFNSNNVTSENIEQLAKDKIWSSGTSSLSSKAQLEFVNFSLNDKNSIGKNQMNFFQEEWEHKNNFESKFINSKIIPNNLFKDEIMPSTVKRTFNQAIKVLNEILTNKKYSNYEISHIFIELAREMNSADEANKITKELKSNEKELERLCKEHNILLEDLKRGENRLKFLLWCQQNKRDLYDGKDINLNELLNNPQAYHIDHILPISVSLNDSMNNKVVTKATNNELKGDLTPYQWLSKQGNNKYNEYKDRCLRLLNEIDDKNKKAKNKLKNKINNYLLYENDPKEEIQGFISRQLNDSRYISILFSNQLKDFFKNSKYWNKSKIVISPINGSLTTFARKNWFNENDFKQKLLIKNRDIYSHHAIDASIIAFLGLNKNIEKMLKFKSKNIQKRVIDGKECYVDVETGVIELNISDFLKDDAKKSYYFRDQMRNFLDKNIKNLFCRFSRMVIKKSNLALSNETLYSLKDYNDKKYKISKLSLLEEKNKDLKYYFWDDKILEKINDIKEKKKYINLKESLLIYQEDRKAYEILTNIFIDNNLSDSENAFVKYLSSEFVQSYLRDKIKLNEIELDNKLDKVPLFKDQKIFKWVRKLKILDTEIKDLEEILTLKNHKNNAFYDSLKPLGIRLYKTNKDKYQLVFINALNVSWSKKENKLILDDDKLNQQLKKLDINPDSRYLEIKRGKTLILNNELYYFNGGGERHSNKVEIKILSMKNEKAADFSNWQDAPQRNRWIISISTIAKSFKLCKVDPLGKVYEIFSFDEYFENNMLKY